MHRSYPVWAIVFGLASAAPCAAQAQEPAPAQAPGALQTPAPERPPLGAWFTADALGALPSVSSLFPILTSVADVIGDRIDTGGISAGSPARVGAHGTSWTQTTYRVGDADITNPSGAGTPLLMPGVDVWDRVDVMTGLMPIDVGAAGMAVGLTPKRPSAATQRSLELFLSPPLFNAGSATVVPPTIQRLNDGTRANLFLSGPLGSDRLSGLLSATWIRSSYSERDSTAELTGSLGSVFANVISTPRPGDEVRVIGWAQHTNDAIPHHVAFGDLTSGQPVAGLHFQTAWQHQLADSGGLRLFGSYTMGHRSTDATAPSFVLAERLRDGPIPYLLDPGIGTDSTWALGARLNRSVGAHNIVGGLDLTGGATSVQSTFSGRVGETLNGIPARVWDFTDPLDPSRWSEHAFSAFVGDRFAVAPRVTVDGGLRFETIDGSAASGGSIAWRDLYPRAGIHWTMLNFWQLGAFGSYARYGQRLPLADLAYGDPAAPTANIYRWNATVAGVPKAADIGPLVQKLGPGTGGVAGFSSIDPALKRPHMDEAVLGFDARPSPRTFLRIAAIGRREHDLVSAADVGVPESTYTQIGIPDYGIDVVGSQDDTVLIAYNRSPSTYGADRYLLTNPAGDEASYVGADMIGQVHTQKFFFFLGLTAGRSEGIAANRGFGVFENDDGLVGEAYVDPNALAHAQGRTFTERGYTIKTAGTYTFPHDWTFGIIGRYQDGQHFARLVIVPDLNQGAEAIRAFRNGRTRFTFEMTVDARLQKSFSVGGRRVDGILEAYNLFNEYLEVEEITVTGPTSRMKSASQPPRSVHIGVRIPF